MNAPLMTPKSLQEDEMASWNHRQAQHKEICVFLLNNAPIILKAFYAVIICHFIVLDSTRVIP